MVHKEQMTETAQGLLVRAPAKLNLTLLIAGKRADGFHEIDTIMAKVNLYDELLIAFAGEPGIEIVCRGPEWAPEGKENIIHRACEMILERSGRKDGLRVFLTKNIPAGSGLGSASSDAAATLFGLNKLLDLNLRRNELSQMAAVLGSDAPFFFAGPLARCRGKGEKITEIPQIFDFSALVVLPDVSVATKEVYNDYVHDDALYGTLSPQINALLEKNRIDLAAQMCANMLEKSCFHLHQELAELKTSIESLVAGPVCISGSGSAMFVIVDDSDGRHAREYGRRLSSETGCKSVLVSNNRW
jgi:4-diphosphocytidyl-2-C-methyl-D-erythritol kinase